MSAPHDGLSDAEIAGNSPSQFADGSGEVSERFVTSKGKAGVRREGVTTLSVLFRYALHT